MRMPHQRFLRLTDLQRIKPIGEKDYENGTLILADRYVSSNLIHQASKIENQEEKDKFLTWLDDLEYNVYGLPRPNVTIFS